MKKKQNKLFIVKKYILATSAQEALKKERTIRPDDVWVDEDWRKKQENVKDLQSAIGFSHYPEYE